MNTSTSSTAQRARPDALSKPLKSDKPRPPSPSSTQSGPTNYPTPDDSPSPLRPSRQHRRHPAQLDLDEGFFDRDTSDEEHVVVLPDRIDSPIDTQATEVSLSSSWLSLSGAGSGQSSLGPSRRPSPNPFSEGSGGMGMEGGSWIDAEVGSEDRLDGEVVMGRRETTGRHGGKEEEEMSSIDKVNAWFGPGDPQRGRKAGGTDHHIDAQVEGEGGTDSGHNSNLVFPRLDASVGPGTDSYDTIKAFKTATRFDRSFSQSTVKMSTSASYNTPCQTELHRSFLSDLANTEGSTKRGDHDNDNDDMFRVGFGIEVQSDVISSSDPAGSIGGEDEWDLGEVEDRLCEVEAGGRGGFRRWVGGHAEGEGDVEIGVDSDEQFVNGLPRYDLSDGAALSRKRGSWPSEKEKETAKYWMETVAKGVDGQANHALAWKDGSQKREQVVTEQPDERVGQYDQMKRIALLIIPFLALVITASLSGTSIERTLFPARSDVTPYSSVTTSSPADAQVVETRAQHAQPTIRTDVQESTALVLVGEMELEVSRPAIQTPVVTGKDAVAIGRLEAARMHVDRIAQFFPSRLPDLHIAQYQEMLRLAAKRAQRVIHKASVAIVGVMMHVPRGLIHARARFGVWFNPKLKRTTDVVVADGKAAWSLAIMTAKKGVDKTSENIARALSDFKASSIKRTNQIVTGACGVGQGIMDAQQFAAEHIVDAVGRMRSGQLALVRATVAKGSFASAQISRNLQIASSALRIRMKRYREETKSRMASIKTRRPHNPRPQAYHKKTAHHEQRKRRGFRQ